jgi:hypothetical protein
VHAYILATCGASSEGRRWRGGRPILFPEQCWLAGVTAVVVIGSIVAFVLSLRHRSGARREGVRYPLFQVLTD